ncbi:MAG TPA: hypothetical protein VGS15_04400 [Candidatus Acidoferrales bacterium]|nr:hypothetical protein [Candidatus Acidoferrales bacterium]
MPDSIATIDTSVLVSLQSADLIGEISVLFNRILVPARVREELKGGGNRNDKALAAIEEFGFFEHCDDYDPAMVKILLDTRENRQQGRDEGEAETVVQASQRAAQIVLTDDWLGRDWAKRFVLECHGTIWICYQLRRTGFLNELRPYYIRMLQHGRRLPLMEMNKYLQELGEALIQQ